jgi:hypothetical protein
MPSNIFQSISSPDWMSRGEDSNSGKHKQTDSLFQRDASGERQGIFTAPGTP